MNNSRILRCRENPLITASDVKPSGPDMCVEGVFNCGGTQLGKKTYLVCRVAEKIKSVSDGTVVVPLMGPKGRLISRTFDLSDPRFDFSDRRVIVERSSGKTIALTSFSTLRLAESDDGIHFSVSERPLLWPDPVSEEWGMEDPRVTGLQGCLYLTYSSVSRNGVGVSLAITDDFSVLKPLGMILPPTNKDAVLFPQKIGGKYYLLHRPSMDGGIGDSDIWIADSVDLLHWGNHRHLCGCRTGNSWESRKIGAGAPPVLTDKGWVVLYHGVDNTEKYSVGVLLLDRDDPSVVQSRTVQPIMVPEMSYEKSGFFAETVFPCTALKSDQNLIVYYGAADSSICRVDIPLEDLIT